ncbi:MAG: CTP synthase (glutamine hydrolyzing) [Euryarchaeota archaeon]|nr:CTP synthase (glutamine hydrolyzing) [Euryarchaeota archaeon]
MKYIIVTGGVISGLGKGITTSSIAKILKSRGLNVTAIKIDPYLNYDAGTMNPYQHGEVFVLDDGGEVDLDLGNYERFLDTNLSFDHNITTGKVYKTVIERERRGEYLGKTVQIIPHITEEIKRRVKKIAVECDADVTIIEIGGTVGDIESMPFLEAMRQLWIEEGTRNVLFVHTTLVPIMDVVGEQKTKPTQHSVKELRSLGIQPDIIIGRAKERLTEETRRKISLFCNVPYEAVISAPDARSIYEVPLIFEEQGLGEYIMGKLQMWGEKPDWKEWKRFLRNLYNPKDEVTIGIVGKYVHLKDSYISHSESLTHASAKLRTKVNVKWIDSEDIEEKGVEILKGLHGILIPGGFGSRGSEGKIMAAQYARENNIPFLGVCFGFQLAVVEFARHVLGYEDANSTELHSSTSAPVIDLLPEQRNVENLGGTMRLGSQKIIIEKGSEAYRIYRRTNIYERHRHRYEVNPEYIEEFEKHGLHFSGKDESGERMEIFELPGHIFYMGAQFHPELKSRPLRPSPLHLELVRKAIEFKNS